MKNLVFKPFSLLGRPYAPQDLTQKGLEPVCDTLEVVSCGGQDSVYAVTAASFEVISIETVGGFQVADDGFDRAAAPEFFLDGAVHAAHFWPGKR